jgi:death on curing protein
MNIDFVVYLHSLVIDEHGGANGIRDNGLLESAINRPYATFDSVELYPDAVDKAAAILESILINHPFIDGNKRTGYVLMRLMLMEYDYDITASQDEKYSFVIEVTEGKHTIDTIKEWIKNHLHG